MNLKRCGRKWSWPNLRYYPNTLPKELKKNEKSVRIASLCAEI
jgi:hypothetical protein